jgi:hypothetical protein
MSGHHQIEVACIVCHTEPFGSDGVLQAACVECHGAALEAAGDSHPKRLFTDPRNADRIAVVDARRCVTRHREHRPGLTRPMGVTIADDHCFHCHADIAEERPSHRGLAPEGCASAGCHNYHDNSALYEDFLVKHLDEPETLPQALLPRRNLAEVERQIREKAAHPPVYPPCASVSARGSRRPGHGHAAPARAPGLGLHRPCPGRGELHRLPRRKDPGDRRSGLARPPGRDGLPGVPP